MSDVIPFPGRRRATFSYLDGGRHGLLVLFTDEDGRPCKANGPFGTAAEARERAIKAVGQYCGQIVIDWDSFPYEPDPKNGEVCVSEMGECHPHTSTEYVVVHIPQCGDVEVIPGFATLRTAQVAASRRAREHNAVLAESARPDGGDH